MNLIKYIYIFLVCIAKDSSSPTAQMVTARLTSSYFHPDSFSQVNYAGKGLVSTQACSQHGYIEKVRYTDSWELPSVTSFLLIADQSR